MRVICTFVPPLVGGEIHDAEGSYATNERMMKIDKESSP
jgi:hypothetical protein